MLGAQVLVTAARRPVDGVGDRAVGVVGAVVGIGVGVVGAGREEDQALSAPLTVRVPFPAVTVPPWVRTRIWPSKSSPLFWSLPLTVRRSPLAVAVKSLRGEV